LQNRDGGWPTFCRGWGKLPFDRSGADLTAHALRALQAWKSLPQRGATANAVARGFRFLKQVQRADGSWVPLWFGNQDYADEENPVYGTAKVLLAYGDCQSLADEAAQRGLRWLTDRQNADGGWGGGPALATAGLGVSSVEETGLAVEALAAALTPVGAGSPDARVGDPAPICADLSRALQRGVQWLVKAVESPAPLPAAPIGFYFAKLWYYEKLYPLLFTLAALGRAQRCLAGDRLG
jgi:squalene-hopene/tetraprenyl-beta-curcumene cyclase